MALQIASLNSGSNGNCYYIGNDAEAIFIDAGLSCRETERRMKAAGLDMHRVRAIFISHEHTDHICGLPTLLKKWHIPVYITPFTHSRIAGLRGLAHKAIPFEASVEVSIGSLRVMPFRKHHDGCDPHSFTIAGGGARVGVLTDIGRVCKEVVRHFSLCDAAFLEANYDEVMLRQGRYPHHLQARISGGRGHLSNREALELFTAHRSAGMSHLLLAHLSKENNHPDLALQAFLPHAGGTEVAVASRYKESPVYTIHAGKAGGVEAALPARPVAEAAPQLALF